jgi:RNA polymerase sigma-70 factor, ECF subfamily
VQEPLCHPPLCDPPIPTSTTPPSDESLVTSALGPGGSAAFAHLIRRYEKAARATALAILKDHHLACDAAQEAFVAAFKSLATLRDRSSFGAWLMTITHHCAVRLARKRKTTAPLTADLSQPSDHPSDDLELLSAISALPEHERTVVILRYFQNHDISAIAEILGRPVGTVTKQLSRAHAHLRQTLREETKP